MITLGFDPGLTGAVSALDGKGCVLLCEDLPVIRDGALAWIDADELLSTLLRVINGTECVAVVERQSARPGQGVSSTFKSGCCFGALLGVVQIARASLVLVTAASWKRALGLSDDKNASRDKARLLFPAAPVGRVKDHGRAESLLIAHWHLNRRKMADFMAPIAEDRPT